MSHYAVILAGGKGERFWPLSTSRKPKQLLSLVGERPLLALLDRARRDTAVSNRAAELLTQRLIATRRELEDVRSMVTVESQGGH